MKAKASQYGERSVLIEDFDCSPLALITSLEQAFPGATIRAGLESLVITFQDHSDHFAEITMVLDSITGTTTNPSTKIVEIPVIYDGEDLTEVARTLGIAISEVISIHASASWQVKLIGFAPGFPYLVPLEENLLASIGRLETPRTKVPAGSVGIAAGMSCIYPSQMPGGWHLIGRTDVVLFDANNSSKPNLLSIGDVVRFVAVNS